jgi:hypothetical protein
MTMTNKAEAIVMSIVIVVGVTLGLASLTYEDTKQKKKNEFVFEYFQLPTGEPCYTVNNRLIKYHVGVTCDYTQQLNSGEYRTDDGQILSKEDN